MPREFDTTDILITLTGVGLVDDYMERLQGVLDFMVGGRPYTTSQITAVRQQCAQELRRQHVGLLGTVLPPRLLEDRDEKRRAQNIRSWMEQERRRLGATMKISPISSARLASNRMLDGLR